MLLLTLVDLRSGGKTTFHMNLGDYEWLLPMTIKTLGTRNARPGSWELMCNCLACWAGLVVTRCVCRFRLSNKAARQAGSGLGIGITMRLSVGRVRSVSENIATSRLTAMSAMRGLGYALRSRDVIQHARYYGGVAI